MSTMRCSTCEGNVFVDTMYNSKNNIELSCLQCGRRWNVKSGNMFAKWLRQEGPYKVHGCGNCKKRWYMCETKDHTSFKHYENRTVFACKRCDFKWALKRDSGVVRWLRETQEQSSIST